MKLIRENCNFRDFCFLHELTAVIYAVVDRNGYLQEANAGFHRLVGFDSDKENAGTYVGDHFVQPAFWELTGTVLEQNNSRIFDGLMTIGTDRQSYRTVTGAVFSRAESLLMIAEYDVEDLEALNATVIQLNEELGDMQRQLVRTNRALREREKQITELMLTDPLTGLPNRRHLEQFIEQEFARMKRQDAPFSLAVADIDFFKKVNDRYGHDMGDRVLVAFAERLRKAIRTSDFVARTGGEEFVIVYPNTSAELATEVTERLMEKVRGELVADGPGTITASYGVAERLDKCEFSELLRHADEALYRTKALGRDQVAVHQTDTLNSI